jgi:hypothetical protein
MARWSPPLGESVGTVPGQTWARWSSLVRLAVWGGQPRCAACGSIDLHGSRTPRPAWTRALRLAPCRCDRCGTVFDVPRRMVPPEVDQEPEEEPMPAWEPPPAPKIDLSGLDREMERLNRRSPHSE